ncbi:cytochrome P450 [Robiginitalea sp.]|uniref:cytochrome P450 n=1 Tax=Robiginitalea sp. TaxID=1902411 RepID=UPI003C73AEDF
MSEKQGEPSEQGTGGKNPKSGPIQQVSQWEVIQNRRRILSNPLPFHREKFDALGNTFIVRIGPRKRIVFTREPDTIRSILQKNHRNYAKSELQTRDLAKYIGHGILTSEGDFWRKHRKMIQPAFHKDQLRGLLGLMFRAIREELQGLPENEVLDIFPRMSDLAFQVVAQSLFRAGDFRKDMNRLQEITEENQKMLIREMRQPYLKWWFKLSGRIGYHLGLSTQARELLDGLIEERVQSGLHRGDLLDMLLGARYDDGRPMPRHQLIDELIILFTAGHETTANALSFAVFLLARHPEKQERLYTEVRDLDFGQEDTLQVIRSLGYTQQCIEEAMRLFPPVYVIDRVSLSEEVVNGHPFPAGTTWLLSLYELHRSPNLWEDPEAFIPERFEPQKKKAYTGFYFPFGAGPRMCIGNNFAMNEMVLAVGWLVQNYRITTPTDVLEINPLISLKPGKVPLRLELREPGLSL